VQLLDKVDALFRVDVIAGVALIEDAVDVFRQLDDERFLLVG
jgi:hypothetical protein